MFNIGDVIVYGAQGICKISCIEVKQIGKENVNYYVLKPLFNQNTSVYVPVDNTTLTAKMQSVLTVAQAKALVDKSSQIEVLNFADANHKHEQYKNILASGNREDLISLIKTIIADREIRRVNNKKLNINDEQTLRKAEMLLYNELAFVYGVEPDEAKNLINF